MAAAVITVTTPTKLALGLVAWTAPDADDGAVAAIHEGDILLARNTDAADPHSVTVTSVADDLGRTGDITQAVAAGAVRAIRQSRAGFAQTDGTLALSATDVTVEFAVIRINN